MQVSPPEEGYFFVADVLAALLERGYCEKDEAICHSGVELNNAVWLAVTV
jgi:hypothetical protein